MSGSLEHDLSMLALRIIQRLISLLSAILLKRGCNDIVAAMLFGIVASCLTCDYLL